ncbi:hypothetical protein C7437_101178 [Psychrobacillus insolitus]|uniref:Uncharacterized protein n=1 Tax=Psychrobacillus insolitus TaxID=1461 RepID=A0A2W7MTC5_9BACI|nr:hypothetical protein [Psychrobacillus insolitus]PZX07071.1 hypothetical protein C7437_101178 [Psychrobacillus insolitus]
MKSVQNEKGYTLLLTLVIIFIIIIFFSSFSLSAMNQQKQVEKTDENYEATAIAEMGVEYYQTMTLNLIAKHSKIAKDNILGLPADELNNSSISNIKVTQMGLLKDEIRNIMSNSNSPNIEVSDSNTFKITDYINETDSSIPNGESWTIYVTGSVDGENKLKTKIISATFALPAGLNLVATTLTSGSGNEPGTGTPTEDSITFSPLVTIPTFPEVNSANIVDENNMPIPPCNGNIQNNTCRDNSFNNLGNLLNSNIYTDGSKNFEGNGPSYSLNSKVYINGNLNFNNLNNQFKRLSLYASGTITMPNMDGRGMLIQSESDIILNAINGTNESIDKVNDGLFIYTPQKATFNNDLNANYLTLSADSATFKNLNSFKHSTIEIKKTLEKSITNFPQINFFDNSQIQIYASASFPIINNGIYNESIISVKENATFGYTGPGIIDSNVKVGGIANFEKVVKFNNSNMQVGGNAKFFIQNSEAGMESSTIVVDSISFTAAANNAKFEISNGSKLCIRNGDYDSIKSFVNVNSAGGNKSEIIFLGSPNKNENGFISYYEEETFNSVCGITSTPGTPSNSYEIKDSSLPSKEEITTKIEYN